MLTDQLISFATAELAKKAGFDVEVETNFYRFIDAKGMSEETIEGHQSTRRNLNHSGFGTIAKYWSRPTQALLQRWLREVKNVYFTVLSWRDTHDTKKYFFDYEAVASQDYSTWEEAMEAGLQYCLNRVLQSKEN